MTGSPFWGEVGTLAPASGRKFDGNDATRVFYNAIKISEVRMARRRRKQNKSFLDDLLDAPWQVSIVVGVMAFIGLRWIFPSMAGSNMFLRPIAQASSGLAWLAAGFFFLIGLAVFAKSVAAKAKQAPERSFGSLGRTAPYRREPITHGGVNQGRMATSVDHLAEIELHRAAIRSRQDVPGEPAKKPAEWSIDVIREIEWKRFEDVCQRFYETKGIKSETTALGPDGGIDIRLFQDDTGRATSIVQCKAWGERFVGVKPVRELLGVMTHEKIIKAFFMTSGRFSDDAKEVAKSNRITLIDGEMLLMMIKRLPDADQKSLLEFATDGDYKTPTCPSCGIKMKRVVGKAARPDFWGCHNYPRCRQTLGMRRDALAPSS